MNSLEKILETLNTEKQKDFCQQYEAHLRREFLKDLLGATVVSGLMLLIIWMAHFLL
jgi:trans-aconitate methyltransferase